MTRKWNLPLTYAPKIPKVLSGECTQTIRAGRKFQVGDLISFHGWSGKPYHSPWSFGKPPRYWEITHTTPIIIWSDGIQICEALWFGAGTEIPATFFEWHWRQCEDIARNDGIDPPTGEELGRVLLSMHKIPPEGLKAQIIRWRFIEGES